MDVHEHERTAVRPRCVTCGASPIVSTELSGTNADDNVRNSVRTCCGETHKQQQDVDAGDDGQSAIQVMLGQVFGSRQLPEAERPREELRDRRGPCKSPAPT